VAKKKLDGKDGLPRGGGMPSKIKTHVVSEEVV